jgi:hypothetical protein
VCKVFNRCYLALYLVATIASTLHQARGTYELVTLVSSGVDCWLMAEAPVGTGACLILYVHYSGWGITGETGDCADLAQGLWVLGLTEDRKRGGTLRFIAHVETSFREPGIGVAGRLSRFAVIIRSERLRIPRDSRQIQESRLFPSM